MKTSRSGSIHAWSERQRSRRLATSGRSRSSAMAAHFKTQTVGMDEVPDRPVAHLRPVAPPAQPGSTGAWRAAQPGDACGYSPAPCPSAHKACGLPSSRAPTSRSPACAGITSPPRRPRPAALRLPGGRSHPSHDGPSPAHANPSTGLVSCSPASCLANTNGITRRRNRESPSFRWSCVCSRLARSRLRSSPRCRRRGGQRRGRRGRGWP